MTEYKSCTLCPRNCKVDRTAGIGYCKVPDTLKVARAALHMWEEPCISGKRGSGTIFFSGCNMGCVFCQNKKISRGETGLFIDKERLIEIFFELKEKGANNINLVTGDMFIPTIREAIKEAKNKGFDLPFLLNTSSYLDLDTVKSLEDSEKLIKNAIDSTLGISAKIRLVEPKTIPRVEGKAVRVIDNRKKNK